MKEIRIKVRIQVDLSGRAEKCAFRWFGHVERMNDERIVKRVYESGTGKDQIVCGWME